MVEVLSPEDETYEKLPFYAPRAVAELFVVEPEKRRVRVTVLAGDHYDDADRSVLLGLDASTLASEIHWR